MKTHYKICRNNLKSLIRKAQRKYYLLEFTRRKFTCEATWSLINQMLNNSPSHQYTDFLIENNTLIDSPTNIANSFNSYFTSVGPNLANTVPSTALSFKSYLPTPLPKSAVFLPTAANEIHNIITELGSSSSTGEDEIPISVIKSVAHLISSPLSTVINHSLHSATFPNRLKIAKVISIFKTGKK